MNPVPEDWTPDCDDCRWHLETFTREELYLFEGAVLISGQHVNVTPEGWGRFMAQVVSSPERKEVQDG